MEQGRGSWEVVLGGDCFFQGVPGSCCGRTRQGMQDPHKPLCSAGWGGWSCTDDTKAQSVSAQNLATLLLTLSNLMFLPAIAVAVYRYYLVEASVYTYTMFFSTVGIAFCRVPCRLPLSIRDAASD